MQTYMKLIHRLSRLLKAKQLPHWLYDQEEGYVDASKLTRVVASPATPMTFIKEKITDFRPTLFYFLINGNEFDAVYEFIYNFSLTMERAGAVATSILGVKDYKKRTRGIEFNREIIKNTVFTEDDFFKIRYKRKILLDFTEAKIKQANNNLFHLIRLGDINEIDTALNQLYNFFDKD